MKMVSRRVVRLGLVAVALAVSAFVAVPAMASAAELRDPNGPVEVEEVVNFRSTHWVEMATEFGSFGCDYFELTGQVTTNSGGEVVLSGYKEGNVASCMINPYLPLRVEPQLESIDLSGGTDLVTFSFKMGAEGGLSESSTNSVMSYVSPATEVNLRGPVSGAWSMEFSGDFALYDTSGAVTVE